MDYRSADSITSWFVRSRKPQPDQEEGREQKDQQGGCKQHKGAAAEKKANPVVAAAKAVANAAAEKKAAGVAAAAEKKAGAAAAAADKQAATALAAAEDKKAGAAAAAEAKKVTGAAAAAADKKAAGAAAAAAAAIKKAAGSGGTGDKKPAAAAEKKAAAAAAADTAKGRRAGPGSSSSSETDSDDERERQHAERQRAAEQLKAQKKKAAEERQARDEEAEYRPRIMAYSDSDSDVESHFTRVKTHLLPPSEEKTAERAAAAEAAAAAAAAAAQQAAAIEAALAQRTASRRLSTALAAAGRAAAPHMTAGLAGRATGLLVLGRLYPRATHVAGLVSMAVPLANTAALRAGLDLSASLPTPLLQAATELGQLGKAAAAVAASRILLAGLRQRQRRRLERQQRRSQQQPPAEKSGQTEDAATGTAEVEGEVQEAPVASGRLLRRKSSVNLAALGLCADLGAAIERRQPESAADWAAVYAAEMREMRRMLQENEVELPPNRFDASNAELMRYARACGLISAKTPEQRAAALEAGVSRVVHTSEWVARQRWMSDRELRRWERLVAWKAHDSSGRPILLARLGRAQQLVKPERCEDMATALLTLVHRGLSTQLSNTAGPAEQMVVVLDCRGGSSMGLGRHMGLLKKLAVTLNQHYPDRLYRLHLLELPLLLRWVMHGITPLLHPNTRSKVVFSSMTDPGLPVTVAHLSKTRSALKPFSLKRSLSNCSFPSSGDATPALRSPQHTPALGSLGPAVSAAAIQLGSLEAACSGGGATGGGCSVASTPRQQQQQQPEEQPLGEEDMPTTPPPTLKVPQSPREGCKPRGQAQARSLARQLSMSDEQQQEQQQLLGLVPPSPFGSSLGLDLQQRPQLQLQAAAQQQQQQQPLPVPFSGSQAGAALNPAAAPGSTAESASAGVVSHAVPWSPGAHSPASSLSRASSYHSDGIGGEEPVAAAPAKAAADAAKELEEWRLRRQAAATAELRASLDLGSSGSQAGGSQRMLRVESADSLRSLAVLPAPAAVAAPAPASAPAAPPAAGSTGSGGKLAGWLGALLPAGAPQGDPSQQQQLLPPRGRRPSVGRLALGGVLGSSFASSAPSSAQGGRLRKGGLVEFPDRQLRLLSNPGRGPAPRKSSLRRSESADPLPASRRQLGSHPLRRQSSVSWAEELESVKEIMPRQLSPRQVARARMTAAVVAAAAQPQLVLVACMSLLVLVALLQRALLSLALAA